MVQDGPLPTQKHRLLRPCRGDLELSQLVLALVLLRCHGSSGFADPAVSPVLKLLLKQRHTGFTGLCCVTPTGSAAPALGTGSGNRAGSSWRRDSSPDTQRQLLRKKSARAEAGSRIRAQLQASSRARCSRPAAVTFVRVCLPLPGAGGLLTPP